MLRLLKAVFKVRPETVLVAIAIAIILVIRGLGEMFSLPNYLIGWGTIGTLLVYWWLGTFHEMFDKIAYRTSDEINKFFVWTWNRLPCKMQESIVILVANLAAVAIALAITKTVKFLLF